MRWTPSEPVSANLRIFVRKNKILRLANFWESDVTFPHFFAIFLNYFVFLFANVSQTIWKCIHRQGMQPCAGLIITLTQRECALRLKARWSALSGGSGWEEGCLALRGRTCDKACLSCVGIAKQEKEKKKKKKRFMPAHEKQIIIKKRVVSACCRKIFLKVLGRQPFFFHDIRSPGI